MSGADEFRKLLSIAAVLLGAVLAPGGAAVAAQLTTLYAFGPFGSGDGFWPRGPLAFDNLGALYGTTSIGGAAGGGTVFKLTPPADPSAPWTERVLYSFTGGRDGFYPLTGVIFGKQGNLYGTASEGGNGAAGCGYGCGTVFEGLPPADPNGPWGGRVLWRFTGTPDGGYPNGLFLDDSTGVLYGTTVFGGVQSTNCSAGYCGTVFTLTPPPNAGAPWTFSVIYRFTGGADGGNPGGGALVRDMSGVLYGTTGNGGAYGQGTVFQLTPGPAGYSLKTIWSFTGGADGAFPFGSLTFNSGRLFGATGGGGAFGFGTIFEGFPPAMPGGDWGGAVYGFTGGADGAYPNGGLVFDNAGNLYGTAGGGGVLCQGPHLPPCGTAFKGIPPTTPYGAWGGELLWTFTGADGFYPGPLVLDAAATALYGATNEGGAHGTGTVFKLTP